MVKDQQEDVISFHRQLEQLLDMVIGSNWRALSDDDMDDVFGIAIVYAILNGAYINPNAIAGFLGIEKWRLSRAFKSLAMNGVFLRDRLERDRLELDRGDITAWAYYAGYASGRTGNVVAA